MRFARDFARRSLLLWRADSQSAPTELLPLTRPSTSAWLSDERGNVGRTRQGGSCGRARARTCARGRAGRSRRPPCGGDTCHGGDPNLCSTSAAACCADACNGHFRRTDACRPAARSAHRHPRFLDVLHQSLFDSGNSRPTTLASLAIRSDFVSSDCGKNLSFSSRCLRSDSK